MSDDDEPNEEVQPHIRVFNEIYADPDNRKALDAVFRVVSSSPQSHIEKKDIVDACEELTLSKLNSKNILEKLEAVAVLRLVTKVVGGINNEEYVLVNTSVLETINDSEGWGLRDYDLKNSPGVEALLRKFANRYDDIENPPSIESSDISSPHEIYLEHHLAEKTNDKILDSTDEVSVSIDFNIESKHINSNTTKYKFELEGEVSGITTANQKEIISYIKQQMVQLTIAATHEAESQCPCGSIKSHLQNIESEKDECVIAEDCHYAKFTDEDRIELKTKITNLEKS